MKAAEEAARLEADNHARRAADHRRLSDLMRTYDARGKTKLSALLPRMSEADRGQALEITARLG